MGYDKMIQTREALIHLKIETYIRLYKTSRDDWERNRVDVGCKAYVEHLNAEECEKTAWWEKYAYGRFE